MSNDGPLNGRDGDPLVDRVRLDVSEILEGDFLDGGRKEKGSVSGPKI